MRALILAVLLCLPGSLHAEDLRKNAFFLALQGSWTGDGEFLSLDKPPSPVRNHIECAFNDDGTEFTIKGNLVINESPTEYVWKYTAHEIEGIYRARWTNSAQPDFVMEYSVNIDQENLIATLEPAVGAAGSSIIRMVKTVKGDQYQVEVHITDSGGNTTLQGTVKFAKD